MTKAPTPTKMSKRQWQHKQRHKKFHYTAVADRLRTVSWSKIHLWRHSIVLALHYFQGMACYRIATLLEVMDTRSFWIMFVFSRVIYLRSCISEVHSNNSCFSINKKKSVVTARLEPTPSKTTLDLVLVLSPPLYQLSYHSAEGEGLILDI